VKRKERESNPQGREARPGSSGVPSPVGLPFRFLKAPVGGIEPPIIGLTGRRLTVWPHRIMSVRTAGIEPAFSCSPTNLRSVPDAGCQTSPRPDSQSAQWESNPHFRHGKAVGCHYIMGAWLDAGLSKIESTGRDSNPRRRITGAVSWPLDHQCLLLSVGPVGIEPTPAGLKVRCAASYTTTPCAVGRMRL
jgi:hypothetical protein